MTIRLLRAPSAPAFLLLFAAFVAAEGSSHAAVIEPNGISVPGPPNTASETPLQTFFTAQGEMINAVNDANVEPGVFKPLCDFQVTLVLSQSNAGAGLAWYNMPTDPMMSPADIYPIGAATLALNATIASADIRTNPNYTPNGPSGGLIGFVLTKPNIGRVYYSEYQRNANCTQCTMPGYWKMALAYRSTATPNAYYLAFEDWEAANNMTWHGNDGDFNDKVFKITGVTCEGGGETCTTGMPGICANGVTECRVGGAIICKPIPPTAEVCDNLDNNCDGMVDNNATCPAANQICDRGVCIFRCNNTEFPCDIGLSCVNGLCVDPRCEGVNCSAGQVCRAGDCVGGCSGVVCPIGQECLPTTGACVDLCAGVSCPGEVCERGACVTSCDCRGCAAGKKCAASGRCVDTGCETMTCAAGQVCHQGTCKDPCTGAMCPGGAACSNGNCETPVVHPTGAAGGGGGPGPIPTGMGGASGRGGSNASGRGGASGTSGGGATDAGAGSSGDGSTGPKGRGGTSGCGCSTIPGATPTGVALFLALILVTRRRRHR